MKRLRQWIGLPCQCGHLAEDHDPAPRGRFGGCTVAVFTLSPLSVQACNCRLFREDIRVDIAAPRGTVKA